MLRSSPNCSTTRLLPTVLWEVISVTSAMVPRWRSKGVATVAAMTSGLAPAICAWTTMVGKSTWGSGATGKWRKATIPARVSPRVSSVVATGRRMKTSVGFMGGGSWPNRGVRLAAPAEAPAEIVEGEVDHRGGEKRQHLAHDQPADNGDAERLAQLRTGAAAQHEGERPQDRRHGRHQDWPEAQQAGLVDRLPRRLAFVALRVQGEVDHHDRVLLDDANQQHDSDDGDDVELVPGDHQAQQGADPGRGQGGEDRHRMDEALIEHAKHDVDRDDGGEDQQQLVAERRLEAEGGTLEGGEDGGREADLRFRRLHRVNAGAERDARGEVEGDGGRGELALMVDLQRCGFLPHLGKRQKRHLAIGRGG